MNVFFYNSNEKCIENLYFSSFGKILVLVNVFLLFKFSLKKYFEKLLFSAFGKILVLANAVFYSNSK